MLTPLEQWFCDTCGKTINSPKDGWIEWLVADSYPFNSSYGYKIVHHRQECFNYPDWKEYDKGISEESLPLSVFIGLQGYYELLCRIDIGEHIRKEYERPRAKDLREYLEIMKRLTIPYYEEARILIKRALSEDFISPNDLLNVDTYRKIVEHYE
jgi:hypothetical protein